MSDEKMVNLGPGQAVSNRWTITKKLGAGAFGAVYLCEDRNIGLVAALKTEPLDDPYHLLAMEVKCSIEFTLALILINLGHSSTAA